MLKPQIKSINLNSITINWSNIYCGKNGVYLIKLQICDNIKEWKTIYYGPKLEFKVDRLAVCTCYNFRIQNEGQKDWIYFKAATQDVGPYTSVIHMTRAVKLGKTSVIRKIAHIKPLLLNIENKENKTPIFQAIEARDLQIIHLLVALGANINKPQLYTNRTPLMFSIYKGELQAAKLLIDKVKAVSFDQRLKAYQVTKWPDHDDLI
ncbi:unnamed protein product [Ceutorhynchus assimilis]|uniref:Uncharacterized protein n=1 Tax=Ceutorhynchus assimilis TaxID=467358 RepID=A0A9P0DBT9_9CUCU|nr:unnamed protein product [Ceutorhynchus assimilis]